MRSDRTEDLTGKKFSRLTAIEFSHYKVIPKSEHSRQTRQAYWRCRCDCGVEKVVNSSSLKTRHTRSCGCLIKGRISPNRKQAGYAAKNLYVTRMRKSAESRNLEFNITPERLWELGSQVCYCCGALPALLNIPKTYNGSVCLNGIDRIDSSRGYIEGNCAPCCADCNYMKQEDSLERFLAQVKKIYAYRFEAK